MSDSNQLFNPSAELEHPLSTLSVKNRDKARLCMLILTHKCNLHCTYCYEKFKANKIMPFEMARSIVISELEMVNNSTHFEWLVIELFGGEPLLQFDVIKKLVEWSRHYKTSIPLMFMITSNGTLLDEEKKAWFFENKDRVVIGVSYDGSEESQMCNRGHSNKNVLQFCKNTWPNQSFRMTVPPESLTTLAKDILCSLKNGYIIRAELAGGLAWSDEDRLLFEKQLRILKDAYLASPSLFPVMLARFFKGGEDNRKPTIKACGAGEISTCYDIDGVKYPCQMFIPLTVGANRASKLGQINFHQLENRSDEECSGCPIKHWCPTCYGMNYIIRGHTALRDHGMCSVCMTQAMVTCEFQMELLVRKGTKMSKKEASLLKFLIRIHKELTHLLYDESNFQQI